MENVPASDQHGYWTRTTAGGLHYHAYDPATEDEAGEETSESVEIAADSFTVRWADSLAGFHRIFIRWDESIDETTIVATDNKRSTQFGLSLKETAQLAAFLARIVADHN